MSFFVTGTDTEVGKTFFTALLVRALRTAGIDAVAFKPVACGGWDDVDALAAAANGVELREAICPYHFSMPASPLTAAWAEQATIEPARILDAYEQLRARHAMVIVEGVGGWRVPITVEWSVADLATQLALPVVVVVKNRLGAINHTLLTLESIASRGLDCAGIVLNHAEMSHDPASRSNRATFEMLPGVRVLCELVHGQASLHLPSLALPGVRL
ncbi:MAG: dethiobiotin synthase [Chthoniobacterales bacterium]